MVTLRWWNLIQTFTQSSRVRDAAVWPPADVMDRKAMLWDGDDDAMTLCSSPRPLLLETRGLLPKTRIGPVPQGKGRTPWEAQTDGADLLRALERTGRVTLAPAVWTRQTEALAEVLRRRHVDVTVEAQCSHGRVFQWNTRVGMRDLFLSLPRLRSMVVPSVICHDVQGVRRTISRFRDRPILVKSNFALGGFGNWLVRPGRRFDPPDLTEMATENATEAAHCVTKGKAYAWAIQDEPFVVEEVVGILEANTSITLDARIGGNGRVEIVGWSEQILANGRMYQGIRCLPDTLRDTIKERVLMAAEDVAGALEARGYRGYFNLDFCVTPSKDVYLVDMNVRRSAPLDVHMLLRRMEIPERGLYWTFDEAVPCAATTEQEAVEHLDVRGLLWNGDQGALTLGAPFFREQTKEGSVPKWAIPVLVLAEDREAGDELQHRAAAQLQ